MEKEAIISKTQDVLAPFETEHIITFVKSLTLKSIFENPWIMGILIVLFFFAVIKRSKVVLLFLFTLLSLLALITYTLPEADQFSTSSLLPFAFGCLGIGSVLIYFIFIKTE